MHRGTKESAYTCVKEIERSKAIITVAEAAEAGIIPALTVKQRVWVSTHAFVRSAEFDEGDLPHQDTKEVFVEAQVDKLGPSRIDLVNMSEFLDFSS